MDRYSLEPTVLGEESKGSKTVVVSRVYHTLNYFRSHRRRGLLRTSPFFFRNLSGAGRLLHPVASPSNSTYTDALQDGMDVYDTWYGRKLLPVLVHACCYVTDKRNTVGLRV